MRPRQLKWGLLAVMVVAVGAMIWSYAGHRGAQQVPPAVPDRIDGNADMALGRIRQTSTRDGVKEWDLEAGSAQYMDDQKRVVFDDVTVTFFMKNRQEVTLRAAKGDFNTESRNLDVSGHVVVSSQEYRLETEALSYRHDRQVIGSDVPVTIFGNGVRLTGDSLRIDLAARQAELNGRVKGTFDVEFTL